MRNLKSILVVLLSLALVATACSSDEPEAARPARIDDVDTDPADDSVDTNSDDGNLAFTSETTSGAAMSLALSEGQPIAQTDDVDPVPVVDGEPLAEERIDEIVGRLPEWIDDPDDSEDFKRPTESLRPPISGTTIANDFPATGDDLPPEVVTGPLEVLRFQPEGEVGLAPYISVTFNQAMVALGTLGQLDIDDVPVTILPEVPGHWEWIGTRTLRFESDSEVFDRLPMATEYTVEVPAGTVSLAGNTLASAERWTFDTPPPIVRWLTPQGDSLGLEPIFLVAFDQTVDADAVLPAISLEADGEDREIRLATAAEIEADENAGRLSSSLREGRWLAFTPTTPLPTNSNLQIAVGPGVPSTEGPVTSTEEQAFSARTYPPLRIDSWNCRNCQPLQGFQIGFSNPLDEAAFEESMVTVSPAIPGMTISVNWNSISISGATAGDTDYEVTVSAAISDVFDQTLGEDESHTFSVGHADPILGQFERGLIVVDPMADDPALVLPVINHDEIRLIVHEVQPSDWDAYDRYRSSLYDDKPIAAPGREIADTILEVDAEQDVLTYLDIALGDYFEDTSGQLVITVLPAGRLADLDRNDDLFWRNRPTTTWAQSTNIGLDAFSDQRNIVVWATALDTGEPMAGATVTLRNDQGQVTQTLTTGSDGTARAALNGNARSITATNGDDLVWLDSYFAGQNFTDEVRWHIIDDRGIYRPGETVSAKGWVREFTLSDDAQLELVSGQSTVSWTVMGPRGNELDTGTSAVSPLGGFDLDFELPLGTNLGQANLSVNLVGSGKSGSRSNHVFQVQEFRRPEFEVTARNETVGPYFTTDPATVAVEAAYFSGGPLPSAEVDWNVSTQPTSYNPPNWDGYTFGRWTPWWWVQDGYFFDDFGSGEFCCDFRAPAVVEQFSGVTDASGAHYLSITFGGAEQDRPSTVTANAAVMDVNRQVWSASTSMLVHSGRNYVGLAGEKTFVRKGEPLEISAIVTDVDGNAVAGSSLDVVAEVLQWKRVDGTWEEVAVEAQTCSLTTTTEAQTCTFDTEIGGKYRISAVAEDENGGQNLTEITRWISGGKGKPSTRVEQEQAELVPDKETYQPGDTAEILVQSPFGPAEGLLILTRHKIVETRRFTIEEDTAVLSIPIDSEQIPNLGVRVELTGTAPRLDDDGEPIDGVPDRPAYASGSLNLRIPPISRTLEVMATPQSDALEPGSETSVDVTVLDADGNPVEGAELLLVVVDEAVLALTDYELADPIETFYRDVHANVQTVQTRSLIRLTQSDLLNPDGDRFASSGDDEAMEDGVAESADAAAAPVAATARQKNSGDPIDVRANFDALAVFEPELTTGADGTATMSFTMPDNLTRYRVMVVAVEGDDQFGSGEANITARLPLQVRPSAPRFLNFGDVFELPVVVQNQTDLDMTVEVVMETSNLTLTGVVGQEVTVPANDRIEVRFPAKAEDAGTASFRVAAVSGDHADAATLSLPVYTPATSEAFATYGVVDDGAVFQPVLGPEDVWPQFGGLEINTSSTALQSLTDAVIYVNDYPFTSSDAAASQILSIASLRDVLGAFDAKGLPSEAEMDQSVRDAITTIVGMQNSDGGFPYWTRNRDSVPYNSVHVVHALAVARERGFEVPDHTMDVALIYLREIEQFYPSWYSQLTRDTISSYAVNVRAIAGLRDRPKAEEIFARSGDDLSLDALAWLWPVIGDTEIDQEIARKIANRVTETAAGATFVNNYSDDDYVLLHSNRRTDGIVLDALISQRPQSDLIPKVVQGLLAAKTNGRWGNLQENTFILLALHEYFVTFEDVTPDFVARVWLGGTYAAQHTYVGRTTEQNETLVPMSVLIEEGDTNIVLSKEGQGRLYYRLGLNYAPVSLDLDPLDRGFVVQRTYEAIDDPDDVRLDDDGVWHVKAGAEVRVRLVMTADSRRTHVALVDPLPAGLEILNPALAPTEDLASDGGQRNSWFWWQWFHHQNLRDDRAEAFTNYLWAGTYDYSYIARATTPGTFVVPPAKAEEMYHPETFGRSATDKLVVETN